MLSKGLVVPLTVGESKVLDQENIGEKLLEVVFIHADIVPCCAVGVTGPEVKYCSLLASKLRLYSLKGGVTAASFAKLFQIGPFALVQR